MLLFVVCAYVSSMVVAVFWLLFVVCVQLLPLHRPLPIPRACVLFLFFVGHVLARVNIKKAAELWIQIRIFGSELCLVEFEVRAMLRRTISRGARAHIHCLSSVRQS